MGNRKEAGVEVAAAPEAPAGFNYELPPERIAQEPPAEREAARMLGVTRGGEGGFRHHRVADLPDLLSPGDLLVRNRSRVFPARLHGRRAPGGGAVEVLLLHAESNEDPALWRAMARPMKRLRDGQELRFGTGGELRALVAGRAEGSILLRFEPGTDVLEAAETLGEMPLPPYIRRPEGATEDDRIRYQTVFARERGSVAAPTAGLHLTEPIFAGLRERGVAIADIVLHVGPATFLAGQPGRAALAVEPEVYFVPAETRRAIEECRGRVVAVGTTTTRALESAVRQGWPSQPRPTDLVLHPGVSFEVVGGLLTNFHLPGSSLLALVAGFAGIETARAAYEVAVREDYRFYSYGDAMLVL